MNQNEQKEIWKPIPNYEGLYEVSNTGKVKSLGKQHGIHYFNEFIMKGEITKDNYQRFTLNKNKNKERIFGHQLVTLVYKPNPNPKKYNQINHINHNTLDNRVENLEWIDNLGNTLYDNIWRINNNVKPILQYDLEGNLIKEWLSIHRAAKELKLFPGNILKVLKGIDKTSGGYKWKYKEELEG